VIPGIVKENSSATGGHDHGPGDQADVPGTDEMIFPVDPVATEGKPVGSLPAVSGKASQQNPTSRPRLQQAPAGSSV